MDDPLVIALIYCATLVAVVAAVWFGILRVDARLAPWRWRLVVIAPFGVLFAGVLGLLPGALAGVGRWLGGWVLASEVMTIGVAVCAIGLAAYRQALSTRDGSP